MNYLLTALITAILTSSLPAQGPRQPEPPPQDKQSVFARMDSNGDNLVSKAEFMSDPRSQMSPSQAEQAFAQADQDLSGSLSFNEFALLP